MTNPASIHQYPDRTRTPATVFTVDTLALVAAQFHSWQQGPGDFGCLHLHSCWGDSSALARGYHGSTTWSTSMFLQGVLTVAKNRSCDRWRHLADTVAAQLLWQLTRDGGFIHASAEFEPTYTREESCPIHQMMPMIALSDYYEQLGKDTPIAPLIEEALARHVSWFARHWWKRGNAFVHPLRGAGWCGVTNQDLVAVCALARYGAVFDRWEPFEQYGLPTLDVYLGPDFFHRATGLFERGDKPNFTERCSYLNIIAEMLHRIHDTRPDARIPAALTRISEVLLDAVAPSENGDYHLATGANDEETGRAGQIVWQREKMQLSDYPEFLITLRAYGNVASGQAREKFEGLERTLASYVFRDGGIPTTLDPDNALFCVAPAGYALAKFWGYLVSLHPMGFDLKELPRVPSVRRRRESLVCGSSEECWEIWEGGEVVLRGIKQIPHGVLKPGEHMPNFPFPALDQFDYEEEVLF